MSFDFCIPMLDQLVVFHLLQQLLISVDCEPATRALYDEDLTCSVAYLSILFMSMSVCMYVAFDAHVYAVAVHLLSSRQGDIF